MRYYDAILMVKAISNSELLTNYTLLGAIIIVKALLVIELIRQ